MHARRRGVPFARSGRIAVRTEHRIPVAKNDAAPTQGTLPVFAKAVMSRAARHSIVGTSLASPSREAPEKVAPRPR
jgi:hypothetical protein